MDVRVIVPIYNGYEALVDCFKSLQISSAAISANVTLHLIDDCSTDERIWPLVENFSSEMDWPTVTERNSRNEGFVKTVNRGLDAAEGDVIILNSDTLVANDWIDRLIVAAGSDSRVSTVTPFSNNATICSYPEFCAENPLPTHEEVVELDDTFARVNAGRVEHIPTGVGYCMLITQRALDEVGTLDAEKFGRGYGEENDFCLRAAKRGFVNIAACNVFVGHAGGVSFGAEKEERLRSALRTLEAFYPGYEGIIAEFCHRDPLRKLRTAVWLYRIISDKKPVILIVTHSRGGGSEKFFRDWAAIATSYANVVLVQPSEAEGIRVGALRGSSTYLEIDLSDGADALDELRDKLNAIRILVNHTIDIPGTALDWIIENELPYDVMLHDYCLIGGSPTLTDSTGCYTADDSCILNDPDFSKERAGRLLQGAANLFCPSKAAIEIYKLWYPSLSYVYAPHPEPCMSAELPVYVREQGKRAFRVVVIGALSPEKGADVLADVADISFHQKLPIEFVLVGYAYRSLGSHIMSTGRYDESELDGLLERMDPDLVWFPAKWPETYSYTLSSALKYGAPLLLPQIGAFCERTTGRGFTFSYPWEESPEEIVDRLLAIRTELRDVGSFSGSWTRKESYNHNQVLSRIANLKPVEECAIAGEKEKVKAVESLQAIESFNSRWTRVGALILKYRVRPGWHHLAKSVPLFVKRPILKITRLIS